MNLLTNAESYVADQLFATLDSTMRKLELPVGRTLIISDTVGFINKLPHQLIASFRTTLEEIENADILLHVIDSSDPEIEKNINVVNQEINRLAPKNVKIIKVFNKIDLLSPSKLQDLKLIYPNSVFVSALKSEGRENLIERLNNIIKDKMVKVHLNLPYDQANWIEKIHNNGQVLKEEYQKNNIYLIALIPESTANRLKKYSREVV
jgi:GTP-binding protein HflX